MIIKLYYFQYDYAGARYRIFRNSYKKAWYAGVKEVRGILHRHPEISCIICKIYLVNEDFPIDYFSVSTFGITLSDTRTIAKLMEV